MAIQDFGEKFSLDKLYLAQDLAKKMTQELAGLIHPGMNEFRAHELYDTLCLKYKVEKNWHTPKIRFGPNTLKSFYEVSEPYELKEIDIFFIDIGPVFDGHEADYAQSFSIGEYKGHKDIIKASELLFHEVREQWQKKQLRGTELYSWAKQRAQDLGYVLNMGSDGHRIGDFPHHLFFKGPIIECQEELLPNAWILEIQLDHPHLKFGAFFEDILK